MKKNEEERTSNVKGNEKTGKGTGTERKERKGKGKEQGKGGNETEENVNSPLACTQLCAKHPHTCVFFNIHKYGYRFWGGLSIRSAWRTFQTPEKFP